MTTDTDLRAYLDAHGTDGAPKAPGYYVAQGSGIVTVIEVTVAFGIVSAASIGVTADVLHAITRHAPLRLAAPGEVALLTAERDAAEAEVERAVACANRAQADARLLAEACADLLDADGGPYVDPGCSGAESECACPVRHDLDAALRRYVPDLPKRAQARGEVGMRWEDVAALRARVAELEARRAVRCKTCIGSDDGYVYGMDANGDQTAEVCPDCDGTGAVLVDP